MLALPDQSNAMTWEERIRKRMNVTTLHHEAAHTERKGKYQMFGVCAWLHLARNSVSETPVAKREYRHTC